MNVGFNEKNKSSIQHRRLYFKWSAREDMKAKGNLLLFIAGAFITAFVCVASAYLLQSAVLLFDSDPSSALMAAVYFIVFLVTAPVFWGLFRMACLMSKGEKAHISDVLWCFDGFPRLRRVYALSIALMAGFCLIVCLSLVLSSTLVGALVGAPLTEMTADQTIAVVAFAYVLIFVLLALSPRLVVLPALFFDGDDVSLSEAAALAKKAMRGRRREIVAFNFSFLPLVLLSILSLGILFFVYLLPLYMIAAHKYASYFAGCVISEK